MWRRSGKARGAKPGAHGVAFVVLAFALTLSACATVSGDNAAIRPQVASASQSGSLAATPFYVEFRTRPYFSIMHIFILYGAQDPDGKPLEWKTIGFYPEGGAMGPFIGAVVIPGVVGQEDYYAHLPANASFRLNLTAEQYQRLTSFIEAERAKQPAYSLFFHNCNDFVADAAKAIGLKVPFFRLVPPPVFITLLEEMNT
jgi:hypothetical protein